MARKIKKYKVGTNSETYAISMVEMPAIEEDFIALAKEEEKIEVQLSDDAKHMVYGAVLVPDKDIYRNNGEQEFYISFSKDSIEKMSQDFMKEYRQNSVTVDHEDKVNEVCVVESWIKADLFKDKSVALGLNEQLPIGTWFCGMKVNNIETWERIKAGELKGFSVESMISLEEFSKNDNNMNIETNEMFWTKFKNVLSEVFTSVSMSKKENEDIEPISMEDLAANSGFTNVEDYKKEVEAIKEELEEETPTVEEAPKAETVVEEAPKAEETAEEPKTEEEPKVEEKPQDSSKHLEELINSLKEEISALKEMNNGLNDKVKELSKKPSAKPVNTNAKTSAADTYSAWREQMRSMIG